MQKIWIAVHMTRPPLLANHYLLIDGDATLKTARGPISEKAKSQHPLKAKSVNL